MPRLAREQLPMRQIIALASLFCCSVAFAAEPPLTAQVVSVAKIWDAGQHNAFTDLLRSGDRWVCVFREAEGHVSADGKVRVIASKDGEKWESLALLSDERGDLRDPKLCLTPKNELMLSTVVWTPKDPQTKHQSLVYFSSDGKTWDGPHAIGDKNFWLWRTSWHDGAAYNVGYATAGGGTVRLYRSQEGRKFESLVADLGVKNEQPNESALSWQKNGDALCLLRCEKPSAAQLGTAKPPYKDWTWRQLDQALGGPNLIQHASGRWLAAGRIYKPSVHTSLCWLDIENHKLVELAGLPSGGDTSYPGLAWHDGLLSMSYYSSHEGKTSIYLAKLKVNE
jgi:hypothetical protein